MRLSQRVQNFPEYIHATLARAAADVEKKTGRKVLNFGAGSPDVRPSEKYLEKFNEFVREPSSHLYPGYRGIPEFNQAIQKWYKARFGVVLDDDEILPLLGGKDGIAHLPLALLDEGDEFLVPDPGYPAFSTPGQMVGGVPVIYDLLPENDFMLNAGELRAKHTPKTKYAWINFPSNPTGQVASIDDLTSYVVFAKDTNTFLIHDNCYAEIAFDSTPPSILQVPDAKEHCVELGSFSKAFSFAGLRMGWIVGNREVIAALAKVKSQMDSGMWVPLQKIGAYALTNTDTEWHAKMIGSYKDRRDVIAEKFRALGCTVSIPQAALYLWCRIPESEKDGEEYTMKLLNEKNILVTPGSAFGKNGERYIRVSYCVNIEKLNEYL